MKDKFPSLFVLTSAPLHVIIPQTGHKGTLKILGTDIFISHLAGLGEGKIDKKNFL